MSQERQSALTPENRSDFATNTKVALTHVIMDGKYDTVLGKFRYEYEHDLQNWGIPANEHRQYLKRKLGYVISLHDFSLPTPEEVVKEDVRFNDMRRDHPEIYGRFNTTMDDSFRASLLNVAEEVLEDGKTLNRFADSLRDINVNFTHMTVKELEGEIVKGFLSYDKINGYEPGDFVDMHTFQRNIRDGLREIVDDPQYEGVLQKFRAAFEYRRKLPWLEEGMDTKEWSGHIGLAGALEVALNRYRQGDPEKTPPGEIAITPTFRRDFKRAVDEICEDPFILDGFALRLDFASDEMFPEKEWEDIFPDIPWSEEAADNWVSYLTKDQLKGELVKALDSYWREYDVGLSYDPL